MNHIKKMYLKRSELSVGTAASIIFQDEEHRLDLSYY